MKNDLIENIEKLHTTPMGLDRIHRNLRLSDDVKDVVAWCREKILDSKVVITRQEKNWYVKIDGCEFTVNSYSFTMITAHIVV